MFSIFERELEWNQVQKRANLNEVELDEANMIDTIVHYGTKTAMAVSNPHKPLAHLNKEIDELRKLLRISDSKSATSI